MNLRRWHYLRANKQTRTPTSMIFLDTETMPCPERTRNAGTPHILRCWCATHVRMDGSRVHSRTEAHGGSPIEFWDWLYTRISSCTKTWVWAHNLAFDMLALNFARALQDGPLTVRLTNEDYRRIFGVACGKTWTGLVCLDRECSIIETRHRDTGKTVVFLDTLNYWRCSLAEIGTEIGLPKCSMPTSDGNESEWRAYCQRDVAILERGVLGLSNTIKKNDLGNMRYTAPAQGLQAYRHRFMDHRILIHNHGPSLHLERQAYYGGLTAVYRYGRVDGPIHVLDVQSFYPSIGASCALPCRWLGPILRPNAELVMDHCRTEWVIARVRLRGVHRPLPLRLGHRLIMAVGNFTTTLHWPELINLDKWCESWAVEYAVSYVADVMFRRFSLELWEARQSAIIQGKNVQANVLKLIMNGLHGKLGQRAPKWINRPEMVHDRFFDQWKQVDAETGEVIEYQCVGGLVQERRESGRSIKRPYLQRVEGNIDAPGCRDEAQNSCPSIAGAMTSWGRVLLDNYCEIAGRKSVYYVDTDCLHVNQCGFDSLQRDGRIRESEFGALSLCGTYSDAKYLGPKAYRLDGEWTIAGRKKNATEFHDGKWSQRCFAGWPMMLSAGINGDVLEWEQECELGEMIEPGRIDQNGWVSPVKYGTSHVEKI